MFVIRLPNGNLQVPQTAVHTGDGRLIGDVYVEIGPEDTEYARLPPTRSPPTRSKSARASGARATPRSCVSSRSSRGSSVTNFSILMIQSGSTFAAMDRTGRFATAGQAMTQGHNKV